MIIIIIIIIIYVYKIKILGKIFFLSKNVLQNNELAGGNVLNVKIIIYTDNVIP